MSLSNKKISTKTVTISRVLPDVQDVSANNSIKKLSSQESLKFSIQVRAAQSYVDNLRENIKRMMEQKRRYNTLEQEADTVPILLVKPVKD